MYYLVAAYEREQPEHPLHDNMVFSAICNMPPRAVHTSPPEASRRGLNANTDLRLIGEHDELTSALRAMHDMYCRPPSAHGTMLRSLHDMIDGSSVVEWFTPGNLYDLSEDETEQFISKFAHDAAFEIETEDELKIQVQQMYMEGEAGGYELCIKTIYDMFRSYNDL